MSCDFESWSKCVLMFGRAAVFLLVLNGCGFASGEEIDPNDFLAPVSRINIQAKDSSSHFAHIVDGAVMFDDDALGGQGDYPHGMLDPKRRVGTSGAVIISGASSGKTENTGAHADIDGVYSVRDGERYCWSVTYSSRLKVYTAVEEESSVERSHQCANVIPVMEPAAAQ